MSQGGSRLEELLRTEGIRLHALLYRLTLSTETADDLLQELCTNLLVSETFAVAETPVAFALRAAVNLGLDWRRQKRRQADELPDCLCSAEAEPSIQLGNREELERILDAVQGLREPLREILVLRYIEGESYESIASALGKNRHQIRGLAHKGIREIRAQLDGRDRLSRRGLSHERSV
jgi:RNA polymerase sigma factor (sigma-70 family)